MAQSGVWRGMAGGKRGKFRFEHVRIVTDPEKTTSGRMFTGQKDMPKSVGDLLQKIGLVVGIPLKMIPFSVTVFGLCHICEINVQEVRYTKYVN